jgi:hypothetical protein
VTEDEQEVRVCRKIFLVRSQAHAVTTPVRTWLGADRRWQLVVRAGRGIRPRQGRQGMPGGLALVRPHRVPKSGPGSDRGHGPRARLDLCTPPARGLHASHALDDRSPPPHARLPLTACLPLSTRAPARRRRSSSSSSRPRHHLRRTLRTRTSPPRMRLSSLLTLRTLVSVPSTCVPTAQAALGSCCSGTGTKMSTYARAPHPLTRNSPFSCCLLSGPPTCAPTLHVALVSSRRHHVRQARHAATRAPHAQHPFPSTCTPQLSALGQSHLLPLRSGKKERYATRRVLHALTHGATAVPPRRARPRL